MLSRIRSWRPSHSTVAAYMALFVALGGTSYAAVKLPKNSVGASQIKTNGVGSSEVKNGALRKADFRASDLPVGPAGAQGPQGLKGDKGDPGTNGTNGTDGAPGVDATALDAFARVDKDAGRTLEPNDAGQAPQVKGIVQADVVVGEGGAATGTTCFNLPSRPASAMVVVDNADAGANVDLIASVAIDRGEDLGDCPASHNDARVRIVDTDLTAGGAEQDPGPANARFFIWFEL
jgi:hypothetical protein